MTNHRFPSLDAFQQTIASVQPHFQILLKSATAEAAIAGELNSLAIQS